jgi:hypothetical protein
MDKGLDGNSHPLADAIIRRVVRRWRALSLSPRWKRVCLGGARPLRLLFKGVEIEKPEALEELNAESPEALFTVLTMIETPTTQIANDDINNGLMKAGQEDSDNIISHFCEDSVDIDTLGIAMQNDAVSLFMTAWFDLMTAIARKSAALIEVG